MAGMQQRCALVTGGVGDIGLACARRLAANGMSVVICDIADESTGRRIAHEMSSTGGSAVYRKVDVTQRPAVEQLFDWIGETYGRLDVCFSNAGVVTNTKFLDITEEQWNFVIGVNLTGSFHVGQTAARFMVDRKIAGKIIFTGSFVQEVPHAFNAHYCASKGGLAMLAKTMALELSSHRITVNLVAPGIVDGGLSKQEMTEKPHLRPIYARSVPLGHMQSPEEVADVVEFLASDKASYLTGTTILTDGGCSLFKYGMG